MAQYERNGGLDMGFSDSGLVMRSGDLPTDFAPVELGGILLGHQAGRASAEQTTFFKSVGNAAQDMVCAAEILAVAEQLDLGQVVEL
ncbi:MAG: hypothetical protein O3A00_11585 [Planctomycetota bacterium]|nr:hypothetical protein [Planctomycetota bacterium]